VAEFGEWLCEKGVEAAQHWHMVFGIPKILRQYFLFAIPLGCL
jgi:hypothetical protein